MCGREERQVKFVPKKEYDIKNAEFIILRMLNPAFFICAKA